MMSQDEEQLRLLSIFHYVVAGLAALFALFPLLHLVIGLAMVTGRVEGGDEMADVMGWLFVVFAGAWIVAGLVFAVLLVVSGRNLAPAPAVHVLSRHGRLGVHVHAVWHGPWSVYDHCTHARLGEDLVWQARG
jgi:hypothetical protein